MKTSGFQVRHPLQYGVAPYSLNDDDDDDENQLQQQEQQQQEFPSTPRVFTNNWDESVFLFCAAGLGLFLNLCVIVRIIIRPDIRRSIGGAFIVHSCLLDAVKCLFCFPFAVSLLLDQQPSHCTLLGGAFVLVVTASGFNIVAMVCCEAYRFNEKDFTAIRGQGSSEEEEGGNWVSRYEAVPDQRSTPVDAADVERCLFQDLSYAHEAGIISTTFTPSRHRGYRRFDSSSVSAPLHGEMERMDSNCHGNNFRKWFQTSEPNLCDATDMEVESETPTAAAAVTFGSQPQVNERGHSTDRHLSIFNETNSNNNDNNDDNNNNNNSRQEAREEAAERSSFSSSKHSISVSPSGQNAKESSYACVLFGIVMVYVGSLIVHLGPTIIGGDFNYNDPIGNCLFAYGKVKSYVVQAMWIVIMSVAMLGAIFYLARFDRHVKSKTGRRLAALVRSSVALSRGRLTNHDDGTGQSLELRRVSLGRVRVLYLLTTVFVACWYPLYVLTLADPKFQRSVKLYKLLTFVAWSNSSINPLVLILFDRDVGLSSSDCQVSSSCTKANCGLPCKGSGEEDGSNEASSFNAPRGTSDLQIAPHSIPRVDRISPVSRSTLTPNLSLDSRSRQDGKTKAHLEVLASCKQSMHGRGFYSAKLEKTNFLSLLSKSSKKLSKQDLIHLRRIGSRLGTPAADSLPLDIRRLSSLHLSTSDRRLSHPHPHQHHHHHHHHHHHQQHQQQHQQQQQRDESQFRLQRQLPFHHQQLKHHQRRDNFESHFHQQQQQQQQTHRHPNAEPVENLLLPSRGCAYML